MQEFHLRSPAVLEIQDGSRKWQGATQSWYPQKWQRNAGCGPTNCATLLYYLAVTRPACRALAPESAATREGFTTLMQEVWRYVTPGFMGVNRPIIFCDGAQHYAQEHGVALTCNTLEFARRGEAQRAEAIRFLETAFTADLPVAFLNLARSEEKLVETWHWMTLTGFTPGTMQATMLDSGREKTFSLENWLRTHRGRAALVTLSPAGG